MNIVIFSTCRYIYVIQRTHSVHDRTVTMVCQVSDSNNVGAGKSRPTEFGFFFRERAALLRKTALKSYGRSAGIFFTEYRRRFPESHGRQRRAA